MNCRQVASNVFAVFSMLFANFISVDAQASVKALSVYDIPAGTRIRVAMDNEINSEVAAANDMFTVTVAEPLIIGEVLILPVGTVIEGRILKAKSAASGSNGSLTVSFETLRLADGTKRRIEAILVKPLRAKSSAKLKGAAVFGAAAAGAIIGAAAKQSSGALIGAGIGAGAGAGFALLQKGANVSIKADERFEIETVGNVTLPARDF